MEAHVQLNGEQKSRESDSLWVTKNTYELPQLVGSVYAVCWEERRMKVAHRHLRCPHDHITRQQLGKAGHLNRTPYRLCSAGSATWRQPTYGPHFVVHLKHVFMRISVVSCMNSRLAELLSTTRFQTDDDEGHFRVGIDVLSVEDRQTRGPCAVSHL